MKVSVCWEPGEELNQDFYSLIACTFVTRRPLIPYRLLRKRPIYFKDLLSLYATKDGIAPACSEVTTRGVKAILVDTNLDSGKIRMYVDDNLMKEFDAKDRAKIVYLWPWIKGKGEESSEGGSSTTSVRVRRGI